MGKEMKVILFIVEGVSDRQALESILRKLYKDNHKIRIRVTYGDITSEYSKTRKKEDGSPELCTIDEVKVRIKNLINTALQDLSLRRSDIFEVIQITDTDGVFIPDNNVVGEKGISHLQYSLNGIKCKDPAEIIQRNHNKAEILRKLKNIGDINKYPYKLYFMSRNLDHALYNQPDLNQDDKVAMADKFYAKFLNKENEFVKFLNNEVVNGVPDSYIMSWRFIESDLHSLERHTNLHVLFKEHPLLSLY